MSYKDKISQQLEVVKKLQDDHDQKPSDESAALISRETELLRHLENAAKGQPKRRARQSATRARNFILRKIVP